MRVERERERIREIEKENVQRVKNGPTVYRNSKYAHVQSRLRQKEIE